MNATDDGTAQGGGPVVQAARIRLRPWRDDDAAPLQALIDDFEVVRWLARVPHPYGIEEARAFVRFQQEARRTGRHEGFVVERDGQLTGAIGLTGLPDAATLGYWLGRPHWRLGLMTEAVGAMLRHAFGSLGLDRIHSGIFTGNEASLAIQRRFGFEVVGESRVYCVALGTDRAHIDTLLTRERYEEMNR